MAVVCTPVGGAVGALAGGAVEAAGQLVAELTAVLLLLGSNSGMSSSLWALSWWWWWWCSFWRVSWAWGSFGVPTSCAAPGGPGPWPCPEPSSQPASSREAAAAAAAVSDAADGWLAAVPPHQVRFAGSCGWLWGGSEAPSPPCATGPRGPRCARPRLAGAEAEVAVGRPLQPPECAEGSVGSSTRGVGAGPCSARARASAMGVVASSFDRSTLLSYVPLHSACGPGPKAFLPQQLHMPQSGRMYCYALLKAALQIHNRTHRRGQARGGGPPA